MNKYLKMIRELDSRSLIQLFCIGIVVICTSMHFGLANIEEKNYFILPLQIFLFFIMGICIIIFLFFLLYGVRKKE
jgi:ABC-type arginine/histidine transport system permease subunit